MTDQDFGFKRGQLTVDAHCPPRRRPVQDRHATLQNFMLYAFFFFLSDVINFLFVGWKLFKVRNKNLNELLKVGYNWGTQWKIKIKFRVGVEQTLNAGHRKKGESKPREVREISCSSRSSHQINNGKSIAFIRFDERITIGNDPSLLLSFILSILP